VGFWLVNTIAICTKPVNGAVSSLGDCGLPCGRRDSLCTLQLFRSALLRTSSIAATLGMSGWLILAQQGLAPCQKRQASLDALTNPGSAAPAFLANLRVRLFRVSIPVGREFSGRPGWLVTKFNRIAEEAEEPANPAFSAQRLLNVAPFHTNKERPAKSGLGDLAARKPVEVPSF